METPVTGLSATSTKVAGSGIAGGAALVLYAIFQNKNGALTAIEVVVGGLSSLGSIGMKLWHDVKLHGFHASTVIAAGRQAGAVVEADLPAASVVAEAITGASA